VTTNRGAVRAPQTVIAAGPWSGVVAKLAALDLPIAPTIRQKLVIPHLPAIDQTSPMTIDDETGSHWRPALAGAYALRTDPTTPAGEPLLDVPTDEAMAHALLDPSITDVTCAAGAVLARCVARRSADVAFDGRAI